MLKQNFMRYLDVNGNASSIMMIEIHTFSVILMSSTLKGKGY